MESKTALMKATDLLARQDHSERALKQKLAHRKFSSDEIDSAIDTLKQRNYLDDEQSCARQFERLYSEGKLSLNQLRAKLMSRGFERALIESFIPSDSDERERAAALSALRVKFKQPADDRKLYQFLSTRGFDGEASVYAVDEFKREASND